MAVHNLIKKIKETGSTEHCKESSQPFTATTEENASIFEELVRKKINLVPTIPSGKSHLDIDQQVISLLLGQEKESSLLQTFKNTSDEFSML